MLLLTCIFSKVTVKTIFLQKNKKKVLTFALWSSIITLAFDKNASDAITYCIIGVWLSLARALDLGARGRRFESCHPDLYAGVVQW